MNLTKSLIAAAAVAASFGASAQVSGTLGSSGGTLLTLTSPTPGVAGTGGTLMSGPTTVATIVGGAVYALDMSFADDVVPGENFLAAGPTSGGPTPPNTSTLTFTAPVNLVSFLWGSPDTFNTLTVFTGATSQVFTAAGMGFPVTNGDQSFAQAVTFTATSSNLITRLVFASTQDAFETARFTTAVPEPETYALMLAGLGAVGFLARRRRQG